MSITANKTVMFVDNGLFHAFARRMAPEFKKAYYFAPWQSQFPKSNQVRLGEGWPELERVKYPLLLADEIDLWVFLDVYHADLQVFLESHGARVWGARMGEDLEMDRWQFRRLLQSLRMPVMPAELVTGIAELRKYLKGRTEKFIKLRYGHTRGDKETWQYKDDQLGEHVLDEMQYDLGKFKDETEFIVEDKLDDAVEIGYDGFTVGGRFPDPGMQAYEIKGIGMIGTVKPYADLAKPVRWVNEKLSPLLAAHSYRGFWCSEIRYTKQQEAFFIDPCCRLGSPSNELLQEMFTGWPETWWHGADGTLVSPAEVAKFGVVLMVYSEHSGKNWTPLHYPESLDRWVKLRNPVRVGGKRYSVPQGAPQNVAGIVGVGDTLEKAIAAAEAHAKEVDGHLIEIGTDAVDKALETIKQGEQYGIKFG